MYFETVQDTQVELSILGYERPEERIQPDNHYDANWLVIRVCHTFPYGGYRFTRPCLLTWEVEHLIAWLHAVADNKHTKLAMSFTEPRIAFEVLGVDAEVATLRITCIQAGRHERQIDMWADLSIAVAALHTAAEALERELEHFPPRGERPRWAYS